MPATPHPDALARIQSEVVACERCPRLRRYCIEVGQRKRKAYKDQTYWAKPVPSFGDPQARLLIVGLAPGAHGANRTGRMFTGDRSGDFLYRALYDAGFASQPESVSADDGLRLIDAYITAPVRCAPPQNKPSPAEIASCKSYLERELDAMPQVRVVLALGRIAHNAYLGLLAERGAIKKKSAYPFAHGAVQRLGDALPTLVCAYHPSQQNTQTNRLTKKMMDQALASCRRLIERP